MRLRIECEDAERHLSHLRIKAQGQGEMLIGLGVQLREQPELVYRDGMSALHGAALKPLLFVEDSIVRALELGPIIEVTNEIRKEHARVKRLREQLALLL